MSANADDAEQRSAITAMKYLIVALPGSLNGDRELSSLKHILTVQGEVFLHTISPARDTPLNGITRLLPFVSLARGVRGYKG
jgi:hypothetical protein